MNKLSSLKLFGKIVRKLNSIATELVTASANMQYSYEFGAALLNEEERILRNLYAIDKRLDGILGRNGIN